MVNYWVVRMTNTGEDEDILDWKIGQQGNFVGIGWSRSWSIGDLTVFSEDDKERLKEKLENDDNRKEYCTEHPRASINWVSYILSFVNRIEVGDVVVLPIYPEYDEIYEIRYLIGKIKGHAYYVENPQDKANAKTRRDVDWFANVPRERLSAQLKKSLESSGTVYNIDKHEEEIETLLKGEKFESKQIVIENKPDMIKRLSDIQKRLMDINPSAFEKLVCEVLNLKYGVISVKTRDVADSGIDFVCLNDKGHINYRGQVKRVSRSISNSEILQLRGTLLEGEEGIFVSTTHFTTSSIEEADSYGKKKIHLIGGSQLSQIILDVYDELDEKFKNILKIEK